MKKFFENFNADSLKDFFERHFGRILFVIITAIITTMAVLMNNGYGSYFMTDNDRHYHNYHDRYSKSDRHSDRKPWKVQTPSSKNSSSRSSKSSSSSGHK
ncbi:MAG: hypothetical protein IJS69_04790 [Selenomonadaceae bacterium]|nr:hypothetical protein [Selenomonadaceae bacterium]